MDEDRRQTAPAADRNKAPILEVLRRELPGQGLVLEIASGTGQHVAHFAKALPRLDWQPSEPQAAMHASIEDWVAAEGLENVRPPLVLDVAADRWPVERADAVICINMIHISPWTATTGLMRGAARILGAGAPLVLYGPYCRSGAHTAPSNEAFDLDLRVRNPDWGIRDIEAVEEAAEAAGFRLAGVTEMPANNLTVTFRRT